jgi:hypothetical protein
MGRVRATGRENGVNADHEFAFGSSKGADWDLHRIVNDLAPEEGPVRESPAALCVSMAVVQTS